MTDQNTISKIKSKPHKVNFNPILQIESLFLADYGFELILSDQSETIRALYLGPKTSELAVGQFLSLTNWLFKPETLEVPLIFFSFNPITEPLPKFNCEIPPSSPTTNSSQNEFLLMNSSRTYPLATPNKPTKQFTLSTFQEILSFALDPTKTKVFYTLCTIGLIQRDKYDKLYYKGCVYEKCKKKIESVNSEYYCSKCNSLRHEFKYRYSARLDLGDSTGSVSAVVFDKCAENLFGVPAGVLANRVSQENADRTVFKIFGKKIVAGLKVSYSSWGYKFELFDVRDALEAFHTVLFELSLCK